MVARRLPWLALAFGISIRCSSTPPDPDGPLPEAGDALGTIDDTVRTFAIDAIFLGDTNRETGVASLMAWKEYGYDLDGKTTTKTSTDVCGLVNNASRDNQVDGDEGTDNAWGSTLLPILQTVAGLVSPSATVTAEIDRGAWTLELQIAGLSENPNQTATNLGAQVFVGAPTSSPPAFDQTTNWPVLASSLADGTSVASGAAVQFPTVYATNGTVVALGSSESLVLPLEIDGVPLPLIIHRPIVTFAVAAANELTDGVIAGVLLGDEINASLEAAGGRLTASLCGVALSGIDEEILGTQDILSDETNRAGGPCNAISIGIGFHAKLIQNANAVGTPPVFPPDLCDAGVDGGADAQPD